MMVQGLLSTTPQNNVGRPGIRLGKNLVYIPGQPGAERMSRQLVKSCTRTARPPAGAGAAAEALAAAETQ